jgi:hypothetical protein
MQAVVRKPGTSFGNPLLANVLGVILAALLTAALTSTPFRCSTAIPASFWRPSRSE